MRFCRIVKKTILIITVVLCTNSVALAAEYTDVPKAHWAYNAISSLSEKGIMVGDSSGKYNPNQMVDKFYASKVLAKVAGYKYLSLTNEESLYIQRAYDANKAIIGQYSKAFQKWDSTADKEIAFLLEKGFLTVNDLNQFIVKISDGTEKIRGLSREEYCEFLVRIMGKTEEAEKVVYTEKFSDEKNISPEKTQSVYYLKSLGMVAGDEFNNFNPKGAVTKASMALMTNNALNLINGVKYGDEGNSIPSSDNNVTTILSVSGNLDTVHPSLNAVQISVSSGLVDTYKLSPNVAIYIDGYLRTIIELKSGMYVECVVNNGEITEIRGKSVSTGTVVDSSTNKQLTKVEGTISSITNTVTTKSINVKIPTINAKGIVSYSEKCYAVADNTDFKRVGQTISFSDVQIGEVIYAGVSGNTIYTVEVEGKNVNIQGGKLIAKGYNSDTNQVYLTIADRLGKESEYIVTANSRLSRKDIGNCNWSALRIGDSINMTSNYSEILQLSASGKTSVVTGWLSEILISNSTSSIKVRESAEEKSPYKVYTMVNNNVDLYSLTLDSQVKVYLDSDEVESIDVLKTADTKSTVKTGFVYGVKGGYINLVEKMGNEDFERIYIDNSTKIVDAVYGNIRDTDFIEIGMEAYITIRTEGGQSYAKTITIMNYNK